MPLSGFLRQKSIMASRRTDVQKMLGNAVSSLLPEVIAREIRRQEDSLQPEAQRDVARLDADRS